MSLRIALAGNPNSGKTTLFNSLTGSRQYVGNWPGVTVEKKEGKLKKHKDVEIIDLPGIYSLSPYTLEEVVARKFLLEDNIDGIINIVDGTNLERNLYLTTQLLELGFPTVLAINMMDIVEKNGDYIDLDELSKALGCPVVEISALRNRGIKELVDTILDKAGSGKADTLVHTFSTEVEEVINKIEKEIVNVNEKMKRFVAIKIFEKDSNIEETLGKHYDVEQMLNALEEKMDEDTESIMTNERYEYIGSIINKCLKKGSKSKDLSVSDKIDKIVTNRLFALPIFALIIWGIYYVAVTSLGGMATDWTNDVLFGEIVPTKVDAILGALGVSGWLYNLIQDGIVAGVGAVLGFVPQIMLLFFMLAILESCGYMARVAFIMDRIFRKFGLSGKSFIPMLIGTGCSVPGIMASRTIENDTDRKMTIMTTSFIPCSAKLPIISLIAGAVFNKASWVGPFSYFVGIAAVVVSGIILKKTKMFSGNPAPFVMELPAYHLPTPGAVLRSTWERGWSFIKKAGTIILLATIVIWFTSSYGFVDGHFVALEQEQLDKSILSTIGQTFAIIFAPLGWGHWKGAVAAITGLVAKEQVIGTLGLLYHAGEVDPEASESIWKLVSADYPTWAGLSFLIFNLICAPCFAAIGAMRRELNNAKWTWFALGYQCLFAYALSLIIFNIGELFAGGVFGIWTIVAFVLLAVIIYFLVRPDKYNKISR